MSCFFCIFKSVKPIIYLKKLLTSLLLILFTSLWSNNNTLSDTLRITSKQNVYRAGTYLSTFEDKSNSLELQDVINRNSFRPSNSKIPNFEITESTYWAKIVVQNLTNSTDEFMLELEQITAEKLALYYKPINDKSDYNIIDIKKGSKKYSSRLYLFDINIPKGESAILYLKFKANWTTKFPVLISSKERMIQQNSDNELIKGFYLGILFIMIFYNLLIYFSIKDKSYLYYVLYVTLLLIFQLNFFGYINKYLLFDYPIHYEVLVKTIPSLILISVMLFIKSFLNLKLHLPILNKGLDYSIIFCVLLFFLGSSNHFIHLYYNISNIFTLIISLYIFFISVVLSYKQHVLAKYFLAAWLILLTAIAQLSLSNLGVIPYYVFTSHSVELGTLFEVTLLSFGLAYRINLLKKEKEISQEKTIKLIQEKKNIINHQNVVLEDLVYERTKELELQNKIIRDNNDEKSIMMREIHHRVKNNLQMINSMVRLQSRYLDKENASDSLKEVERRILTMSLLHEKMYQSDNLVSINIKEYITAVMSDLTHIFNNKKNVKYTLNIENLSFKTETILYIGLLVNELITNSLKHAFNEQDDGHLHINLFRKNINECVLNVINDGVEINFEKLNNSDSLGQRLIRNFVKQLNGELSIESNKEETSFSIQFTED